MPDESHQLRIRPIRCPILVTLAALLLPSMAAAQTSEFLALGEVIFEPPYLAAEGSQQVVVRIAVPDASGPHALQLEELVPLGRGDVDIIPVAALRDDGGARDQSAGDGVFSGVARFRQPFCGVRRLQVTDHGSGLVSPTLSLPSAGSYLAGATFVDTHVLTVPDSETIALDQTGPGTLLLTLDDAALSGVSDEVGVDVLLDHVTIDHIPPFSDCAERQIKLTGGEREFTLVTNGASGAEVAVRIDALADSLVLRPSGEPRSTARSLGEVGTAEVTAQGLPVGNAELAFTLATEAGSFDSLRHTDEAGRARASFPVALPVLHDPTYTVGAVLRNGSVPLEDSFTGVFAEGAAITITMAEPRVTIESGIATPHDLTIRVNTAPGEAYRIDLAQAPSPSGLAIDPILPPGGLSGVGPTTFVVRQLLESDVVGTYDVDIVATLDDDASSSASARLVVEIAAGAVGARPVVYQPVTDPAMIRPDDSGPVVFKVALAGMASPPASLALEEETSDGSFAEIGTLDDDGPSGGGADEVAGDLIYTGSPDSGSLDTSFERQTGLRVTAFLDDGEVISSEPYTFEIAESDIPIELEPSFDEIPVVTELQTDEAFAANQLLVGFRPGVSFDRIRSIISQEEASLIGFDPVFEIFQLGVGSDSTAEAVRRAQIDFAAYQEVEFVVPNHQLELALPFPNDPEFDTQESLGTVGARVAWIAAGEVAKTADARDLAVLDSGIDDDHPDLAANIRRDGGNVTGENCVDPDRGLTDTGGHGTMVAGVVAARSGDNRTIAGAAANAKALPIVVKGAGGASFVDAVLCGLRYVRQHPERARVVNLSVGYERNQFVNDEFDALRRAIKRTLAGGALVVAAAGNGTGPSGAYTDKFFPAGYNDDIAPARGEDENGLIAVATTDDAGEPFDGSARRPAADYASRRGPWVDLGAPGVEVVTLKDGGATVRDTGSSLAAPLVAGVASMLWSRHPTATIGELEARLKQGVRPTAPVADEIGGGELDFAETVFNGSMELSVPDDGSAASWPARPGSSCQYERVPASARGFFRPRHGRQFLLCSGVGEAATQKRLTVPPGTERLVLGVRIAGMALAGTSNLRLDAQFKGQGSAPVSIRPDPGQPRLRACNGGVALPGAAAADVRCSPWKSWIMTVAPAPGPATLTFSASHPAGAQPVHLMLDRLDILEID